MENFVITIGRQFGSGGRELGKLLAKRLNISYYDKELLLHAAQDAGLDLSLFVKNDERTPGFFGGMMAVSQGYAPMSAYAVGSAMSFDSVHQTLSDFIRRLAQRESCIIVGRSSDYVLRKHPHCVNIFVHAPIECCVERIMSRSDRFESAAKARQFAEKTNKLRANYYNFYTDKTWGAASSYDLTIDSSSLPMDQIAETIVDYLKRLGYYTE